MSDPSSTMSAKLATLFPDLEPVATVSAPPSRRPSLRAVAAVAIVILALVVAALSGAFQSSGSGYRTAVASTQNVNAALSGVATIEPTLQATVAFPMAGTVGSVGVKIGDKVGAGQTLAQLETQSLQQTVDQQMATLAQDQLALSKALSGQGGSSAGLGGGALGGSGTGTGTTATGTSLRTPSASTSHVELVAVRSAANPQLAAAQQAVLAAQQQVDKAQSTAAGAVSAAVTACQGDLSTPSAQTACNNAVQTLNADEQAVQAALQQLATASQNLDSIISNLPSTTPPGNGSGGGGGAGSSSSGRSGGGGLAGGGAAAAAPTAQDLSADQAAVDAAFANVAVAQQALAQAALTTPIAGTVAAVNMVPGQTVTAASSTANIVVQGSGSYQASTTVSVDNIPHVAVGQSATMVPDGKHKTLSGKVASISIVPNSTSALSTTYLVVVALKNPNVALGNASTGTVTITTQHAKNTLAVPTSAVTTNGTTNTVEVLDGNTVRQTKVHVGVVGYTWTQITSGLTKGELVVLANMAAPLPGSATSSSNSSTSTTTPFRGGFFGGGGRGGGGGGIVSRGG